ncbi:MAG: hypothetical protein MZW92_00445 [Comamonadaceae bacterium]|nr:hypothetical protein [Comamonadaceae bacterium]
MSQILPLRKYGYIDPETAGQRPSRRLLLRRRDPRRRPGRLDRLSPPAYFSELPMLIDRGLIAGRRRRSRMAIADGRARLLLAVGLGADYTMAAVAARRAPWCWRSIRNVPFANGNCHVHISAGRRPGRERRPPARSRPAEDRPGAGSDRRATSPS